HEAVWRGARVRVVDDAVFECEDVPARGLGHPGGEVGAHVVRPVLEPIVCFGDHPGDVATALTLVDGLELERYHYLHATRAELLRRLDRLDDTREAYGRALELVHSDAERRFLEQRRPELRR